MIIIRSPRLRLSQFQMADAQEVFGCITPAIAKFMPWEPPTLRRGAMRKKGTGSGTEQIFFRHPAARRWPMPWHGLIRRRGFCFARARPLARCNPHGQGFGREVVSALVEWGHTFLGKENFLYPVASQNIPSRRIAESLHGEIIGKLKKPKYDCVIYRIRFTEPPSLT